MSAEAIAAAIGTIGNIAGSIVSNKMNLKQNKDFFDYTLPKNQQAQYDMIRNSPELLVQGYKRAGLNPAGISSTYEGGGAQGETVGSTQPITADPVGTYMQMRQLKMNEDINAANVRKANAEAANLEAQTPWIDRMNQAKVDLDNSTAKLNLGTDERESQKLQTEIDSMMADIDLKKTQKSYQDIINEANNKEYDYKGKKVKGSEIPNFNTLVNLKIAEQMLDISRYNAQTQRRVANNNPLGVITNDFVVPFTDLANKDFVKPLIKYFRSLKDDSQINGAQIADLLLTLLHGNKVDFSDIDIEDESKTEVDGKPVD